mmetsp:Transcript_69760/g.207885  ORF Transcript_69760/g.207885 Transcript_69760/m.207885 type:complete len:201 (-) Transcript_69760:774-1376(-)
MSSSNIWNTCRNSFVSTLVNRASLRASWSLAILFSSASSCTKRIIRRNSRRSTCPSPSSSISFSTAFARACVAWSSRTPGKSSSMSLARFLLETSPTPSGSNLLKMRVYFRTSRSVNPWFARCLFRTCIRCFSIRAAKLHKSSFFPWSVHSCIIWVSSFSGITCPALRKTLRTSLTDREPSLSRSFSLKLFRIDIIMSWR